MKEMPLAGHHIILDYYDCRCQKEYLAQASYGNALLKNLAEFLTPLNFFTHQFDPESWTGIVALAESHLALHTWTQHRYVSLDFYTCTGQLPEELVQVAEDFFKPGHVCRIDVPRGQMWSGNGFLPVHRKDPEFKDAVLPTVV